MTARGHRFAGVITDTFSKWTEAAPLDDTKTTTIINFVKSVCSRHGYPACVIADNSPQLRSRSWEAFCEEHHIRMEWSPVTHQRANPVERRVQELKKAMRVTAGEHPEDWDLHLDDALFALRNRTNAATGKSPAQLLLGRPLRRPGEWDIPEECLPPAADPIDRVVEARQNNMEFQNLYYEEQRAAPLHFRVGAQVLCRQMEASRSNFAPKWTGPHPIVEVRGDGVYVVDRNGSLQPVHVDDLRPMPPPRDPQWRYPDLQAPRPPGPFNRPTPRKRRTPARRRRAAPHDAASTSREERGPAPASPTGQPPAADVVRSQQDPPGLPVVV